MPCTSRVIFGDQGIVYCPVCEDCECCSEGWVEKHGHLDYACAFVDDGCVFKDNKNYPKHVCQIDPEVKSDESNG